MQHNMQLENLQTICNITAEQTKLQQAARLNQVGNVVWYPSLQVW